MSKCSIKKQEGGNPYLMQNGGSSYEQKVKDWYNGLTKAQQAEVFLNTSKYKEQHKILFQPKPVKTNVKPKPSPEVVVTAAKKPKEEPQLTFMDKAMNTTALLSDVGQFTPLAPLAYGVGLIPTAYDVGKNLAEGNYGEAAVDAFGFIPAVKYLKYAAHLKEGVDIGKTFGKISNVVSLGKDSYDAAEEEMQAVQKKQDGGTKQPIYVNDPNDPRLQMYNDSLSLYKTNPITEKKYKDFLESINLSQNTFTSPPNKSDYTGILPIKVGMLESKGSMSGKGMREYSTYEGVSGNDVRVYEDTPAFRKINEPYPIYKKPTQPIFYQPWEKLELEELERKQYSSTPQQENIERVPDVKLPNNNSILKTGFNAKYPSSEFYKPANKETIRDVFQDGGDIQKQGYKNNSPYVNNPFIEIYSNNITMDNVDKTLLAIPNVGKPRILPPNSGNHLFPNATKVVEIPIEEKPKYQIKQFGGKKILDLF